MAGQFRKASVFAVSKICRVLAHDLEIKPSLSKLADAASFQSEK